MTERTAVAIVGGGITGLALGYYLGRAGIPHIVFEASDRPGGVIRSAQVEGHLLDWGPQRTRLTAHFREVVEDLGIADQVVTAPAGLPLFIYRGDRLRRVPFSALDFLRSDIVPFRSKLTVLREPLTRGARPDESVATYFTRKLGRQVYENLAGPLYGGLYASDPADMVVGLSLRHALAEFGIRRSLVLPLLRRGGSIDPPAACSFRTGMEMLPRALYEADRESVWLDAPLRSLRRTGGGWELGWDGGIVAADRVAISTPAPEAARLLGGRFGGLGEAIGRLNYNPLAVVHLHAETTLRGLGYQIALPERLVTRGVTFNDSLFNRVGVYTAYLGGSRVPEVAGWSDAELGSVAVREFRRVTGFDARPLSVAREAMPAWDASWSAIQSLSLPPALRLAASWESRPGIPGRLAQAKRLAAEYIEELGVASPTPAR